jgi:hypothetical protein
MTIRKTWCVAVAALALGACGDLKEDAIQQEGDPIIRATAAGGRNEVVMLFSVVGTSQGFVNQTCTGSYYAPRVVLTAAHCLQNILFAGSLNTRPQTFVYFGDNFAQDFSQLTQQGVTFIPPPIGSPSNWAQADSITVHPNWDPNLIHPDMGVVFLDRKPPFDPLPLLRTRVGANVNVTITGWGANTAPTPVTGAGAQVQRTGTTRTLGSPTVADFHPEDPNPGMLNATVRQNVIKLDGVAPRSNTCFGDSGGPFIIRQFGQDYFAGVGYFTGLSCEGYSLFVRLDPFLPFLDLSYKRGGQDLLKQNLDCVAPNPRGTLTAYFGYRNDNGVGITIPYGSKNVAPRDTLGLRPTRFIPGVHHFSAAIDFTSSQTAVWTLSPDNNPTTTVTASSSSPRCATNQFIVETDNFCRATTKSSGCTQTPTYTLCMEDNLPSFQQLAQELPDCVDEMTSLLSCIGNTPPGANNWLCFDGGAQSLNCSAEELAFVYCAYY